MMYMHSFQGGATLLSLGLIFILYAMFVWWRDVLRESTLEGHHTKVIQLGPRYGFILFIVSEVMFLFALFRASFHSSLAPTVEIGGTLFSIICGIRQYLGHLTKEHHIGFEAAAWYWHFVDVEPNQRANTPTTKEQEWVVPRNGRKEVLVQPDTSDGTSVDQRHAPSQFLYDVDEGLMFTIIILAKLGKYGLDAPPARAGLSDGYDRTIDMMMIRRRERWTNLAKLFNDNNAYKKFTAMEKTRETVIAALLVACPKSKKQVTPNAPEGGSKATSEGDWIKPSTVRVSCQLLIWGEGPSNSEVGSQYTDTPVIDRDLSLVTGEHSEGKPALAFSTPTGISLGRSSKPLTLSLDHKPLGGCEPKERLDGMKLDQRERKHDQSDLVSEAGREGIEAHGAKIKAASAFRSALWLLAIKSEVTFGRGETSTWDNLSLGYDLNSTFKKEPDQANQEIGSDEGERELLLKEGESLLLVAIKW
ncbi:cytochrome c oxidase subunit 3 [Tanacetum coccineum]|uniref:Cytochrome c oxidase subunit 3 n=1 Tax=Tanacetum coccineum TaxID=301880 RepID=A0ABQ5IRB1_9ASTR